MCSRLGLRSVQWLIRLSWEIVSNRLLVNRAWHVNQLATSINRLLLFVLPGRFINGCGRSSGSLSGKSTGCWCSCLDNVFPRTRKQMKQPADGRGSLGEVTPSAASAGLRPDNDGRCCISLTDLAANCRDEPQHSIKTRIVDASGDAVCLI